MRVVKGETPEVKMAESLEVVGEKDDTVDSYCYVGDMLTMDECRSNESDALKKFRHPF